MFLLNWIWIYMYLFIRYNRFSKFAPSHSDTVCFRESCAPSLQLRAAGQGTGGQLLLTSATLELLVEPSFFVLCFLRFCDKILRRISSLGIQSFTSHSRPLHFWTSRSDAVILFCFLMHFCYLLLMWSLLC